jgi:hypothetical protein
MSGLNQWQNRRYISATNPCEVTNNKNEETTSRFPFLFCSRDPNLVIILESVILFGTYLAHRQ